MSAPGARRRWRPRLWVKLAAFAVVGVVVMHAVHLAVGNRVAIRALERDQAQLGGGVARLIAGEAADPVLLHDDVTLSEIVARAAATPGVSYCFVVRHGAVLASSFRGGTPAALLDIRAGGAAGPIVVVDARGRFLDLVEPILDGAAGQVRLGIDMALLEGARRDIAVPLGLVALAVVLAGVLAAVLVGRSVADPIDELVAAADRFDLTRDPAPIPPRGGPELERLAERFNRMMTRLRAAHEEQVRGREKAVATERMAALGSLVAGVAHEVNNPIAGMKSCLHRLQREDVPPETLDEYLGLLEDGVGRVEGVMQRLLEFARPRPTRLEPTRLSDLLREGAALVHPLLRTRRVALRELEEQAGDVRALADRRQVGQALLNLLLNAAYVTAEGGEIRVRLRREAGRCGIAVEDDGPGIPPAIRPRVIDPFFSTKPEGEGTGLGLSVTRTIAEAHGGELAFEFPERGTVAVLWLREAPAAGAAAADARAEARGA